MQKPNWTNLDETFAHTPKRKYYEIVLLESAERSREKKNRNLFLWKYMNGPKVISFDCGYQENLKKLKQSEEQYEELKLNEINNVSGIGIKNLRNFSNFIHSQPSKSVTK